MDHRAFHLCRAHLRDVGQCLSAHGRRRGGPVLDSLSAGEAFMGRRSRPSFAAHRPQPDCGVVQDVPYSGAFGEEETSAEGLNCAA